VDLRTFKKKLACPPFALGDYSPLKEINYSKMISTIVHCKKRLAKLPSPAGMSLTKLSLGGNNLFFSRPERVWSVTSRLGTGKWLTLFDSVCHIPAGDGNVSNLFLQCIMSWGTVLTFSCSVVLGEDPAESRHSATPIWPPYTACDRAVKFLPINESCEIYI
jgi:hypothetical protein